MPDLEIAKLITVEQLPVITEQLAQARDYVQQVTTEAAALICTVENYKDVKKKRSELSKMFSEFEGRRKDIKAAVAAPYLDFEAVYKECIGIPFKDADAILAGKIAESEDTIKGEAVKYARGFFAEQAEAHHLSDWLTYERMGYKPSMADAQQVRHTAIQRAVTEFVGRVAQDVEAISQMEDAEAIMVEYKQSLDMPAAFSTVKRRREQERAEKERRERYNAAKQAEHEAVARVEAAAPAVMAPPTIAPPAPVQEPEKLLTITFTATGTREQLISVREYMKREGIKYE